jgi:hypothetical protein
MIEVAIAITSRIHSSRSREDKTRGATGKTDSHCALPVDDDPVRGVPPLLLLLLRAGGTGSSVSGR